MTDTLAAPDMLRAFAERYTNIEKAKADNAEDMKALKAEMKSEGIDVPTVTWAMKELGMEPDKRHERDAMRDLYAGPLGLSYAGGVS